MFKSFTSRVARIALPTLLIGGSLALAQPAAATDWCVNTACGGTPIATFEGALLASEAWPDSDRIFLGAGTYTAADGWGFHYQGQGPVEIIGAGIGQTVLTGPAQMNQVLGLSGGPGTGVRDLSIHLKQMSQGGTGFGTTGTAKRIAVDEVAQDQTANHFGVALGGGGTLEDSSVMVADAMKWNTAVLFGQGGGTLRNSTVSGNVGVYAYEGGGKIERSWVTGTMQTVRLEGDSLAIHQSVVKVNGAAGLGIFALPVGVAHQTVDADGLTVITGLFGGGTGIVGESFDVPGETVAINLRNSVIRGFGSPVLAESSGAGTTTITASYSDYATGGQNAIGANSTVTESNVSHVSDPGFLNPVNGNYRLSPSSPLIDAGDPATAQGLDMDGNPLVTDGNHDGTARRDIGAYEVDGPLPVDPPASGGGDTPPADQPPVDQPPVGSGDQQVQGASTTGTADTQAPLITGFRSSNRTFAVGRALTAISAVAHGTKLRYTLSEAAKVTVKIQRVSTRRVVGKLTRSGAKGANTIKFSGRIGKKALKAGRYRAVLTATDAAGNRSSASRVSFRVVRG
jgi:hypothetical protein